MGLVLGHGHSHGGSHGTHDHSHRKRTFSGTPSVKEQATDENVNVRAAFVHVIGDLLQSLGVFIAALIIKFKVIYNMETRKDTQGTKVCPRYDNTNTCMTRYLNREYPLRNKSFPPFFTNVILSVSTLRPSSIKRFDSRFFHYSQIGPSQIQYVRLCFP